MNNAVSRRVVFIALFGILALIGMRIDFSVLTGTENQYFTLFQFFGPIAGGFLGGGAGVLAVALAQIADMVITGKEFEFLTIARLTPMLFAAYYFSTTKRHSISIAIPLIAIAAFIMHPVGRVVWFFSLYWLIPVIIRLLPVRFSKKLFVRSLGATFTAHAVGGAVWIWAVPMAAEQWIMLIPVVAYERLMFTLGISGTYLAMQYVLRWAVTALHISVPQHVLRLEPKNETAA